MAFRRHYNSLEEGVSTYLGLKWRTTFDRYVRISSNGFNAFAERADGKIYPFVRSAGLWVLAPGNADVQVSLVQGSSDWTFTDEDQTVETYDSNGKLTTIVLPNGYTQTVAYSSGLPSTVTDTYGRQITFTWNTSYASMPQLASVTDPQGRVFSFTYVSSVLTKVLLPPEGNPEAPRSAITYHYENTDYADYLTGITDENGVRYASYGYDAAGRATSSQLSGGADSITVSYNLDGTSTVTNALGKQTIYHFATVQGVPKITQVDGVASANCVADNSSYGYDGNGYVNSVTDKEGHVRTLVNHSRGLPTSITDATGTGIARTTTYTWHGVYPKPLQVVAPNLTVDYTYDTTGNVLTRTETDTTTHTVPYSTNGQTRVWTYTYSATGQLLTVDGPRAGGGDLTTFTYNANGFVATVTNALSQLTTFTSVDSTGLPLSIQDANGVVTNLAYDGRGRLVSTTVDPSGANAKTALTYDAASNIVAITQPNGTTLRYTYDGARRLSEVRNDLSESINYTRDGLGGVTAETVRSATGAIKKSQTRVFDELGRLLRDIGAAGQTTRFGYDKNDQVVSIVDPLGHPTAQAYDALNRLVTVTDPLSNSVSFGLDPANDIVGVTDQRSITTTFVRNGFGDAIRENSPDTGITDYVYDSAGNMTKRTDARGVVTDWTYDNLNRRITKTFPAAPAEDVAYTYDSTAGGNKGVGRLTQVSDASGSISIVYDSRGNVTKETRVIGAQTYVTEYGYDAADNLIQVKYPSGRLVHYARDLASRVSMVTTQQSGAAPLQVVASNIVYEPMGPVATLNFGNGQVARFTHDPDYRLTDIDTSDGASAALDLAYGYNPANDVTAITDSRAVSGLANLTETLTYGGGNNRLQTVADGSTTRALGYTADGNTMTDSRGSGFTYLYSNDNRLREVRIVGVTAATYGHNDRGERVRKSIPSGPVTHYHYDLDGTLIGESDGSTGTTQREYIVLGGQTIAIADGATPVTPTPIMVDNTDPGASWVGSWPVSTVGTGYEGANYAIRNDGTVADSFTWTPTLPASGPYQVQVKYPVNPGRESIVDYTMHHAAGADSFLLNQRTNGGQWNLVGAFPMVPAQSHRLVLSGRPEALPPTEILVDNTHPQAAAIGAWTLASANAGFWDSNYATHAAGSTGDSFTWPAAVPALGRYKIYAWWATAGGATTATYTVHHAGGTTGVTVNQVQNARQWNYLGDFLVDPAAGHKVVLTDDASGAVLADAIRYVRDAGLTVGEEVVVDNTTSGTSSVGTWTASTSGSRYQGSNYQSNAAGTGADSFTWPAQIGSSGAYKIYAKWYTGTGSAPNAKYTVHHAGGTTLVTVNQQQSQGQWVYLGRFDLATGVGHKVVLSDDASSGSVRADAIRYVRDTGVVPSDEAVVDNTSPGTIAVGSWAGSSTTPGYYGSNYLFKASGAATDSFTWPTLVAAAGKYRVYARWAGTIGSIVPDASFTVHHAGGTTTIVANQKQNQGAWNLLGSYELDPVAGHKVGNRPVKAALR